MGDEHKSDEIRREIARWRLMVERAKELPQFIDGLIEDISLSSISKLVS